MNNEAKSHTPIKFAQYYSQFNSDLVKVSLRIHHEVSIVDMQWMTATDNVYPRSGTDENQIKNVNS